MDLSQLNTRIIQWQFRFDRDGRRRLWMKLERMIDNGVSLLDSLNSLRDRRIRAGKKNAPLTHALTSWIRGIEEGKQFHEVVSGWVNDEEIMLLTAGARSGNMSGTLRLVVRNMEASGKIKSAVIKGSAYPGFLLLFAFGAMYLFGYLIVPAFTSAVQGDHWTGLARVLVDFSGFIRDWLVYILGGLVVLFILYFISLPRWTRTLESVRVALDQHAPYSLYRTIHGSSWLISLASMMEAGMRLEDALTALRRNATPWLQTRIDSALRGIRAGHNLGDALLMSGYKFPDPEIIDDLGVYSSMSGFSEALNIVGNEWMEESVNRVNSIMGVIFVVGICVVGGLIGFMVGGMFAMQVQLQSILRVVG